jgi:hypothetical protein
MKIVGPADHSKSRPTDGRIRAISSQYLLRFSNIQLGLNTIPLTLNSLSFENPDRVATTTTITSPKTVHSIYIHTNKRRCQGLNSGEQKKRTPIHATNAMTAGGFAKYNKKMMSARKPVDR